MADYSDPKRATAYRFTMSLYARSDNQIKTAPTLAAGDVKVSKDNGATANITTLPAETPASSGILQVDLSATEMTADLVTVIFRDAAGAEWNDVAVHIAPAVRQMADLAFPNTSGRGMDIDASGGVEVGSFQAGAITAAAHAAGAIDAAALAADAGTEIGTAVWASATRTLTANTNLNDLSAAGVRAAVGLASANLDTQLTAIDDFLDTEVAAIKAKTDALPTDPADASDIAASFATVNGTLATIAGYIDTEVASILAAVDTEVAAIKAKTDNLPADPADASDIAARFTTLDTAVADLPTNAELATALGTADDAVLAQVALVKAKTDLIPAAPAAVGDIPSADITAIKAKTDSLAFTVAGQVDANIQYVNDVQVNGTGAAGNEWGP